MRHLVARGRVLAVSALTSVLVPTLVALPITSLPAPAVTPAKPELTEVPAGIDGASGAGVAQPPASSSTKTLASPQTVEGPVKDIATFQTVGVSWAEGSLAPGSRVELRVRTRDGWSPWNDVAMDDAAPDPGTADARAAERTRGRTASAPLWVGGDANGVQTRVVLPAGAQPPSDMSVLAVNAPGVPLPRTSEPLASADAAAAPRIMTRAQWGADERLRTSKAGCATPSYNKTIKVAVVHHTAGTNSYTQAQVPSVIQGIYAYHTGGQGWCDVGYNFLIDKFGTIWEGRYGGIDKAVVGAHAGGFNADTFGLSFLGNYDAASATSAMLDSASKLIAWKLGMYNRNPLGSDTLTSAGGGTSKYPAGQKVTLRVVSGHRDVGNTTCPGQYVYSKLDTLRNAAAGQAPAAPPAPAAAIVGAKVATKARTPAFNGSADVTAGLAASGTWKLTVSDAAGTAVRTYSGSGTKVAQTWDLRDSAAKPVPAGTYTLRLESTQGGTAAPAWQSTVNTGYWLGGVDSISGGSETVQVAGWAARSETAAPVKVRVDVDGAAVATAVADRSRPDVAAAYPEWGAGHGFSIQAPAKAGPHKVCASGIDPADGKLQQLGCKDVVVTPRSDPFGAVDSVTAAAGPRSVRVRGWVVDPDTTSPVQVHVYVNGRIAHMGAAGLARADVAAAYPFGAAHGYDVTLPVADPSVEVCAYGINVGAGSNQLLGCRKVSLPTGSPFGSVDSAAAVGHGRIRVSGWTVDPDTADATGVHVYVDGKITWMGTASGLRRDVGAAYPGWGDRHGYDVTLPVFPGGAHTV